MHLRFVLLAAWLNGLVLILGSVVLVGVCLHCMIAPPSPAAMFGGMFALPLFAAFAALQYLATLRRRSRAAISAALVLLGTAGLSLFALLANAAQVLAGGAPLDRPTALMMAILFAVTLYLFVSARLNLRCARELEEKEEEER
jgi:hypothetical protein